jgi:hypothetical protein
MRIMRERNAELLAALEESLSAIRKATIQLNRVGESSPTGLAEIAAGAAIAKAKGDNAST